MAEKEPWNGRKMYCYMCGHFWTVRNDKRPKTCPRCRSSRYDVPVKREHKCTYCGHVWMLASIDDTCPECGHAFSMFSDSRVCHCNQCDHEWLPRTDKTPERCPRCDSRDWNGEKMNQFLCKRCGFVWRNKVDNPKKCPNCFSAKWNDITFKLQCKRCGHKWMTSNPKGSEGIKVCPSCKSPNWNEVPKIKRCSKCGTAYVPQKKNRRCPNCSGKASDSSTKTYHCPFCLTDWTSSPTETPVCPKCGIPVKGSSEDTLDGSVTLWKGDEFKLSYTDLYDFGCVYLWKEDYPVNAMALEYLLSHCKTTLQNLIAKISNPKSDAFWRKLADYMNEHMDDYKANIPYFRMRLGLDDDAAEILALHFIGFCPEAISIRLSRPVKDVRKEFDMIMKAYDDKGIVVNDSIFTEDPISLYESFNDPHPLD